MSLGALRYCVRQRGTVLAVALVQPATGGVLVLMSDQVRLQLVADRKVVLESGSTAGGEATAGRQVDQVRHRTRDDLEKLRDGSQHRNRSDQPLSVRMKRPGE